HLTPPEARIPGAELNRLLAQQRITAATFSPSALAALPEAPLPDLSKLIVGGEACGAEVVRRWAPGRRLINAYGPTETTISASVGECQPDEARPSIGAPIPNSEVYVLDPFLEPVCVGTPGELWIGGVGVARGYLNQPKLTAERFLPNPFSAVRGARMYRTGDRARWLPDGRLDFLGRLDDQVNIRGVRIEPGEIEARLRELLGAPEVAVAARTGPGGETELVAYLAGGQSMPSAAELRGQLRAELPAALTPAAFVRLDALPLTVSGKVDRRALPAPTAADRGVLGRVAPRTDMERTVAQVWSAVLGEPEIGVRDHFFDQLGGTSLLVAKLTSQLSQRLARAVPVTYLFEHPTVESLAHRLEQTEAAASDVEATAAAAAEDVAAARRHALRRRARARD
ncbi:MAG: non-ribosomal peptide synthetase, partial [Micromonosporaceae bacterium]